ncbi:hypothetical protein SS1G_07469 [Sclerotinia sclerotiorum 1980 UF-70]|uniref:25S rRNA (uridine-N(3))-methyltransferase BMT5-like domain-containing protein n=2 Tax=Sclerotinia sclerotiorum (strain ATCC 18683 / 1980 / Ss-1) TaxID=665079 RepID=A7EQ69_SCLS1|nr:hypothetical protein SS1G_07469 [Sclerotinia sclerotiorum 1980 UF-70]APA10133.1 hypothetical protein sscle_06g049030 [Sclerotinia sclerotiorum 1980 UF-70]EDO04985.1 hypothetical protein SS1G_07469 [Sclerotinia sclerotiorum 1980 UF-70]
MGKNKRLKSSSKKIKGGRGPGKPKPSGISKPSNTKKPISNTSSKTKSHKQAQHVTPIIPFSPSDSILLIGDGDLSYARSLITHHHIEKLTATVYESSLAILEEKYPQVSENVKEIEEGGGVVKYGVDAMKMRGWTTGKSGRGDGIMDRVIFNFPHVGGKSTDVNRQVRYNQELLVAFLRNSIPSLSPKKGSSIIVTLFEGEPYTLWNIRDLGRHAGLEVERSFKFQASAYPGYRHARTLGVVKGGGGWKGEERPARSYVFVRKGEGVKQGPGKAKRKKGESSDEDSEGEDEDMGDQEDEGDIEAEMDGKNRMEDDGSDDEDEEEDDEDEEEDDEPTNQDWTETR